jgi:predicted AAA+ superfamily ATPase
MSMLIKTPELEISPENPFLNDTLGREENAKILYQFVKEIKEPYVIAVDAPWGSGKSTFLKMWRYYLKSKGHYSIYFNCCETDLEDKA